MQAFVHQHQEGGTGDCARIVPAPSLIVMMGFEVLKQGPEMSRKPGVSSFNHKDCFYLPSWSLPPIYDALLLTLTTAEDRGVGRFSLILLCISLTGNIQCKNHTHIYFMKFSAILLKLRRTQSIMWARDRLLYSAISSSFGFEMWKLAVFLISYACTCRMLLF